MPEEKENLKPKKPKRSRAARVVPIRIVKVPRVRTGPQVSQIVKTSKKVTKKNAKAKAVSVQKKKVFEKSIEPFVAEIPVPVPTSPEVLVTKKRSAGRYALLTFLNVMVIALVAIVFWTFYSKPTESVVAISMPALDPQVITGEVAPSTPTTLSIPSVGINAHVVPVGLTKSGNMNVPESFDHAGWYKYGPVPGRPGNAVIDGHLDNGKGQPGVFFNLAKVRIGDPVFILNKEGEKIQFRVTRMQLIDYDAPPIEEIFGETDGEHLNIVTCDGLWIPEKKTYSERLVVFTERVIN